MEILLLNRTRVLRLIGTLHDAIIAGLVFFFSFSVVIGDTRTMMMHLFWVKLVVFIVGSSAVFYAFSLNRGSWRYASVPDLIAIVKASITVVLLFVIITFLVERNVSVPRSVPLFMLMMMVLGLGGSRLAVRLFKEGRIASRLSGLRPRRTVERNVLLYGLNDSAEMFIRAVDRLDDGAISVVAILDDNETNQKVRIHGSKVIGGIDDLKGIVERRAGRGIVIKELVVADRTLTPAQLAHIVEKATNAGVSVSLLPDLTSRHEISEKRIVEPKPIRLTDLLGRPEIRIDTMEVARLIDGKCILITGAGGSIGSELARQIASFNPRQLIISDNSEYLLYTIDLELRETFHSLKVETMVVDVRDRERVMTLFSKLRPDVVFHAAALKHVPLVEDNPVEALKTNVLGTKNVADAALAHDARAFVMISTDKAVNPTNIMGATKRAAEAYCQALDLRSESTRFKTVRFGNVIGSNGSVVPRFQEQIARGGPVTVTHPEIVRFFMSIPEAVRLVLQASGHGLRAKAERGKILVLDMGKPVSIVDLASKMIQLAGLRPGVDIKIEFTGLRPGEKLYEEMFDESEVVVPIPEHGYSIATPRTINDKILQKTVAEMKAAIEAEDQPSALQLLRHIVPEYAGAHSELQRHQQAPNASGIHPHQAEEA